MLSDGYAVSVPRSSLVASAFIVLQYVYDLGAPLGVLVKTTFIDAGDFFKATARERVSHSKKSGAHGVTRKT